VSTITALPRVDVVMVYQGAPGDLIKAAVDLGAKGIVIASAGAGATSGTQSDGLSYAADKGAVVVTTTRTGSGRISGGRSMGAPPAAATSATPAATGITGASGSAAAAGAQPAGPAQTPRGRRAFVGGEDLQPIKARILLMLALTRTSDPVEIQRMFIEY